MSCTLKVVSFLLVLALFIGGSMFLFRSCMSQYDERSALLPTLYFEKDEKKILFTLVAYNKATSYSSSGSVVRKGVETSYFIQTNEVLSGAKIQDLQIKEREDIRQYPIEVMASVNGMAWLFAGELLAYDPFTLEKKADREIIERENPALKGMLPAERKFYSYNPQDQQLYVTANDGKLWRLDPQSLRMSEAQAYEVKAGTHLNTEKATLQQSQQQVQAAIDSFNQELSVSLKQLNLKNLEEAKEYLQKREKVAKQSEALQDRQDSLYKALWTLENRQEQERVQVASIRNLQERNLGYDQIRTNQDTLQGQWYGLFSSQEWTSLGKEIEWGVLYDEVARRALYRGYYQASTSSHPVVERQNQEAKPAKQLFLRGGFLLDKRNGRPIHLENPLSFLVVHKDKIGEEGHILLSRLTMDGRELWRLETNFKGLLDWQVLSDRILLFGNDNPELTPSECNLLYSIHPATGQASLYDYFEDAVRK